MDDILVRHTSEEDVLFVFVRMELDNVGDLTVAEPLDALACLCVPQLDLTVVAAREESSPVIGEGQIFDMFHVPVERSQTITMRVHVPELPKAAPSIISMSHDGQQRSRTHEP